MRYYKNIFLDKGLEDTDKIKELFSEGIGIYNVYVLCVHEKGNDIFEIMSSSDMLKSVNSNKNYGIIALTKGKEAAKNMARELIEDWLSCHKDLSGIKEFYNRDCR